MFTLEKKNKTGLYSLIKGGGFLRILLLIELKLGYDIWLEYDSEIQNMKILSHKQIRADL